MYETKELLTITEMYITIINIFIFIISITIVTITIELNLTFYLLYETKELSNITKMYITIINILVFIISIAVVTVLQLLLSPLVSLSHSLNTRGGYVILDTCLLHFLCHMTSEVKFFAHIFSIYLFFFQKLQHSMN